MGFETALQLTEILMALAFMQQSAEHLIEREDRALFALRIALCLGVIAGVAVPFLLIALMGVALVLLKRFQGPYNGGADRMSLLVLTCVTLARLAPTVPLREAALGYLAAQLVMSYFISGLVKVVNPEWRSGRALVDVFAFSAYPVSESLRGWAHWPRVMLASGWAVMLFELVFPVLLLTRASLFAGLIIAAGFHLSNALNFGLNRFFWIWLTAYPSLIWLQERAFGAAHPLVN